MSEPALSMTHDDEGYAESLRHNDELHHVPRISVQVFCETPAVQATMQDAFADRRMSKAHKTVQMGGLAAAVDVFGHSPTPNLIMVETTERSDSLVHMLDRLAEVCDAGTRVVVIGHVNDVLLYRDLVRRGVSEYVVAPTTPMHVIRVISEIFTAPDAEPLGRVVSFVGARGGVGASTLAHNVSWSIANDLETNVVIADMDLAFGTAGLDFNQDPIQGLANAVFEGDRVDEQLMERLLFKCTDKLGIYAAPSTLERDYDIDASAYEPVLEVMRKTVPCAVLDVPHCWNGWTQNTLWGSDEVVIVATPDLASLRNCKNLVESLSARRKHDAPPRIVLNQVGVPKRPEIAASDFSDALGIEPSAVINFDPQLFGTAANNGQMIAEMSQNSKLADAFLDLAKVVTGRGEAKKAKGSTIDNLLAKLTRKGGKGGAK
ncbi:MAG: AAA family ATPase [Pseudomonadota bacterium]